MVVPLSVSLPTEFRFLSYGYLLHGCETIDVICSAAETDANEKLGSPALPCLRCIQINLWVRETVSVETEREESARGRQNTEL